MELSLAVALVGALMGGVGGVAALVRSSGQNRNEHVTTISTAYSSTFADVISENQRVRDRNSELESRNGELEAENDLLREELSRVRAEIWEQNHDR